MLLDEPASSIVEPSHESAYRAGRYLPRMAETVTDSGIIVPSFGRSDSRVTSRVTGKARGAGTFSEIGATGLKHWGGFVFEEWARELQSARRSAEVFREACDVDPVLSGLIYAIDILCRRCSWHFEPGGETREDEAAQEFAEQALFEDMSHTWPDTLSEILSFLQYGWSWLEIVWKRRGGDVKDPTARSKFDDGKIGIRKLAIRSQDSHFRWEFDEEGGIQAMTQMPPPSYGMRTIPIDKSLLFRARSAKGNPEGRSILRGAYFAYQFKRSIMSILGIGIERDLAGLPVMKTPADAAQLWNPNDPMYSKIRPAMEELISSIRRDEQEGVILPSTYELELLTTSGRRQFDLVAILEYLDNRMAASVLADVLLLGQQQVGSYALADSKEGLFFAGLDTYLDHVAAVVNNHLVPRLFKLNQFPGITDYPKLAHGPVARLDLATLGTFLQTLAGSGAPIWPNDELLEKVFTEAGLPVPEPDDGLAPPAKPKPTAEPADGEEGALPELPPAVADGGPTVT